MFYSTVCLTRQVQPVVSHFTDSVIENSGVISAISTARFLFQLWSRCKTMHCAVNVNLTSTEAHI